MGRYHLKKPGTTMMMSLAFAAVGLLFVALSIPLIRGSVSPNRRYGFRTAKTLSSPDIWYAANRIAGVDLLIGGLVTVVGCLMLARLAVGNPTLPLKWLGLMLVVIPRLLAMAHSYWRVARL